MGYLNCELFQFNPNAISVLSMWILHHQAKLNAIDSLCVSHYRSVINSLFSFQIPRVSFKLFSINTKNLFISYQEGVSHTLLFFFLS
jgi:hypothetical protein